MLLQEWHVSSPGSDLASLEKNAIYWERFEEIGIIFVRSVGFCCYGLYSAATLWTNLQPTIFFPLVV